MKSIFLTDKEISVIIDMLDFFYSQAKEKLNKSKSLNYERKELIKSKDNIYLLMENLKSHL